MGFFSSLGFTRRWQWSNDSFFFPVHKNFIEPNNTAVIINSGNYGKAYNDCAHLNIIIDKKAKMFSNGEWKCFDSKGKEIFNDEFVARLKNPNNVQTGEDFLKQFMTMKCVYGNNFIKKNQGLKSFAPQSIWNMPPENMKVVYDSNDLFSFTDNNVKEYLLCVRGKEIPVASEDVLFIPENFSYEEMKGVSRIESIKMPISNLIANLKTRNIMTVDFGVKGFISPDGKDLISAIKINSKDREEIEKELKKDFNIFNNKSRIKILNTPTKFITTSSSIKDMGLEEMEERDMMTLCDAFGMKKDIFSFSSSSTFENQRMAELSTYQNAIIPEADSLGELVTNKLFQNGRTYKLTYDWLPIMQADKRTESEILKFTSDRLLSLFSAGIISKEDVINNLK